MTGNERAGHDDQPGDPTPSSSRQRRVDVVGVVAGIVFVSMAIAFAVAGLETLEEQLRLVWPTALLGIGLGMLLGTRRR